jgi:Ran GTPase-activating protein (RanGAP) involved in mRNA processing and transport
MLEQADGKEKSVIMSNSLASLSLEQLKRVVQLREQIETLTVELNQILGTTSLSYANGSRANGNGHGLGTHKRNLSPAARERIAAAQRIRWAKYNATKPEKVVIPGKNRLSPAGRAKVAAAVKARWAKFRAMKMKAGQAN